MYDFNGDWMENRKSLEEWILFLFFLNISTLSILFFVGLLRSVLYSCRIVRGDDIDRTPFVFAIFGRCLWPSLSRHGFGGWWKQRLWEFIYTYFLHQLACLASNGFTYHAINNYVWAVYITFNICVFSFCQNNNIKVHLIL